MITTKSEKEMFEYQLRSERNKKSYYTNSVITYLQYVQSLDN
jgi:hypothetical protein